MMEGETVRQVTYQYNTICKIESEKKGFSSYKYIYGKVYVFWLSLGGREGRGVWERKHLYVHYILNTIQYILLIIYDYYISLPN